MESLPVKRSEMTETAAWASSASSLAVEVATPRRSPDLGPSMAWREEQAFIELSCPPPALQLRLKRIVDLIGAVVGTLLLAPIFALITFAIKVDSAGPAFFAS